MNDGVSNSIFEWKKWQKRIEQGVIFNVGVVRILELTIK